jgi:hypothetical protein
MGSLGRVVAEVTIGTGEPDRRARTMKDDYLFRISAFRARRVAPHRGSLDPRS